ncbi:MAG: hypothetical protein ABJN40_19370 [Sneathiella sp.]
MKRTGRKKEWSILVFSVFVLGVSPPILFVFDKPSLALGVPLSFLYLFGLWAIMILFMAIGARRRRVIPASGKTLNTGPQNRDTASSRVSGDV